MVKPSVKNEGFCEISSKCASNEIDKKKYKENYRSPEIQTFLPFLHTQVSMSFSVFKFLISRPKPDSK